MNLHSLLCVLIGVITVFILGCGDDGDSEAQVQEPQESPTSSPISEGCKHLEFGPFDMVDLATDAATRDQIHTAYTLSLGGEEGAYTGTFTFASPGSGTHYVLVDKPIAIDVTNSTEEPVEGAVREITDCSIAAAVTEFNFEMGETYTMIIGPAMDQTVTLAIHIDGVSHDHHDHGHGSSSDHHGDGHNDHHDGHGASHDDEMSEHEDHVGHE